MVLGGYMRGQMNHNYREIPVEIHNKFIELCQENQHKVKEWAELRGFDYEVISKLGLGFCDYDTYQSMFGSFSRERLTESGFLDGQGHYLFANRIIIPYQPFEEGYFSARVFDGESKHKNLFVKGLKKKEYVVYPSNDNNDKRLFILEGETDTIATHHLFPHATKVGLGGAKSNSNVIRLITENFGDFEIIICFDNDETGQEGIDKLTQALAIKGFKSKLLQFPQEFKDIDEVYKAKKDEALDVIEFKEVNIDLSEIPLTTDMWQFLDYDDKGKPKAVNIGSVADYFCNRYKFKSIFWKSGKESIFVYKNGIWVEEGRKLLHNEIEIVLKDWTTNHIIKEAIAKIKRRTATTKEEFFITHPTLICIENGVFNLETHELSEFKPKYYFKSKFPIKYKQEADCPKIKKFFNEVLYPVDIPVMQEFFGFCLLGQYKYKKAMILLGDTDTGKTITLKILTRMVGLQNIANLSLQKICANRSFDLLDLKDKYVNIYDDLGSNDLNNTAGFKIATGGADIRGEYKFGDSILFRTFAKLIFATNQIPLPKDKDTDDIAFYIRWLLIKYDNQVTDEKKNPELIDELTTEQEISGLFNWAIEGLDRLQEQKDFSYHKSAMEIKDEMLRSGHPLREFADECLVNVDGTQLTKDEMYDSYQAWCKTKNYAVLSKRNIGSNLRRFVPYLTEGRSGSQRYWLNAKLKKNFVETSSNKNQKSILVQEEVIKSDISDTILKSYIGEKKCVSSGISNIYGFENSVTSVTQKKQDLKQFILDFVWNSENSKMYTGLVDIQDLVNACVEAGFDEKKVEKKIKLMKDEGDLFEPRNGFVGEVK